MQKASDLAALEAAASFMATDPAFDAPYRVPQSLEPAPDLLQAAIAHPVNAWRPVPPHLRVQLQKQGVTTVHDLGLGVFNFVDFATSVRAER